MLHGGSSIAIICYAGFSSDKMMHPPIHSRVRPSSELYSPQLALQFAGMDPDDRRTRSRPPSGHHTQTVEASRPAATVPCHPSRNWIGAARPNGSDRIGNNETTKRPKALAFAVHISGVSPIDPAASWWLVLADARLMWPLIPRPEVVVVWWWCACMKLAATSSCDACVHAG